MFKHALALATVLAGAAPAHATTFSATNTYYTRLNFSRTAWGKDVAGVYAHIGVLTTTSSWRGGYTFWDDVQHVRLEKVNDHFAGKVVLHGSSGYEYQYVSGPIVQYWVYFADGTTLVTDAAGVPQYGSAAASDDYTRCEELTKAENLLFDQPQDAFKTETFALTCTHTG